MASAITLPAGPSRGAVCRSEAPAPTRSDTSRVPPAGSAIGGPRLARSGLVVPRDAGPIPRGVTARSWLVADLDTGAVLAACAPHARGAPASVQKLLLAATIMDSLDPKRVVTVTDGDMNYEPGSSAVGLVSHGRYSVATLWLGLLLNSGNDAANVLARVGDRDGVAGTLAAMNTKARTLGALDTHAVTPSGLDGRGQLTSAYDLALIARACWSSPAFVRYITTRSAQIPKQKPNWPGFQIQNTLGFLYTYRGTLGGKSGFSDVAGHTFVGVARRNGQRLVVAMLDAKNPGYGWDQAGRLLDWAFDLGGSPVGRLVVPGDPNPYQGYESPRDTRPVAAAPPVAAQTILGRLGSGVNTLWPLLAMTAIVLISAAILALLGAHPRRQAGIRD